MTSTTLREECQWRQKSCMKRKFPSFKKITSIGPGFRCTWTSQPGNFALHLHEAGCEWCASVPIGNWAAIAGFTAVFSSLRVKSTVPFSRPVLARGACALQTLTLPKLVLITLTPSSGKRRLRNSSWTSGNKSGNLGFMLNLSLQSHSSFWTFRCNLELEKKWTHSTPERQLDLIDLYLHPFNWNEFFL